MLDCFTMSESTCTCTEFVYTGCILIIVQQVSFMMFSLTMVDYSMSFHLLSSWNLFWCTSRGDHSKMFLLFEFCWWTPPSCLKVMGGWWWCWWVGGWLAYSILVSAQGPLVLGFGTKGFGAKSLGPGLDNI